MTMKNEKLNFVVTEACLDRLAAEAGRAHDNYVKKGFVFANDETLIQPSIPSTLGIKLLLDGDAKSDADNAARLYDGLSMLSQTEASDLRLWVYLGHGPFIDYMRKRWPVTKNDDGTNTILRRWLFHSDGRVRAISRNGLSRLWWGAHLTRAPWESDEFFIPLKKRDPYHYTRLLFTYQDVFEGLFGRSFGRDRHILLCTLNLIDSHPKLQSREAIRSFLVRLNLASFHTLLGTASLKSLNRSLEACAG